MTNAAFARLRGTWRSPSVWAAVLLLGSAPSSRADWPPQTVPLNYGLQVSYNVTSQDLDALRDSGVKWVRTVVSVGGDYTPYDNFVAGTTSRGMIPILILIGDPNNPPRTQAARDAYNAYAAAVAYRYRNYNLLWEIWNEPNNGPFWGGSPNAAEYAALAIQAATAIKQSSPHGVLAPAAGKIDVPYVQQVLAAQPTLLSVVDGVSVHPYETSATTPPETRITPYANLANAVAPYIPAGRDVRIVCSEWGYSQQFVSESAQAAYLLRSWMVNHLMGVELSVFYSLRDNAPGMQGLWGVLRNNYTPKESYTAVQVLVGTMQGFTYVDRYPTAQGDYVLRFRNANTGQWKYVAWTTGAAHTIPLQTNGATTVVNYLGGAVTLNPGPNGYVQVPLNAFPKYVTIP